MADREYYMGGSARWCLNASFSEHKQIVDGLVMQVVTDGICEDRRDG